MTHVLLTRSRLCPWPKPGSSLHLHVLSTPPAFVLSQDQTLREKSDPLVREPAQRACRAPVGRRPVHRGRRGARRELLSRRSRRAGRGSGGRTWTHPDRGSVCGAHAVEFSKTAVP